MSRFAFSSSASKRVVSILRSESLSSWFGSEIVHEFERQFASKFGRAYAVSCNSGTSALHIAYETANLPAGSDVLIPANAYVSAATAALQSGLMPRFVDIEEEYWSMDVKDLERKIQPTTSAVVAVHMYGQLCDMSAMRSIAGEHGLAIIEDCAACHGATFGGRYAGSFGKFATFSLCCTKAVTAGEGGIVLTDDEDAAFRLRSLCHKGKGLEFFDYRELGYSYALSDIQAAVALSSLECLDEEVGERRLRASEIAGALTGSGLVPQTTLPGGEHGYFRMVFRRPGGWNGGVEATAARLKKRGISAVPAHPYLLDIEWLRQKQHRLFGLLGAREPYQHDCPVAQNIMPELLCLDIGYGMSDDDVDQVVSRLLAER